MRVHQLLASLLAVTNPGDEVIIFEPFYENFGPDHFAFQRQAEICPSPSARLDL